MFGLWGPRENVSSALAVALDGVKLNYRSVGNNRCFCNSKTAGSKCYKKHYYEEFTCGTVKISFVLYMLLIQYLQFVDGDLSSNGRIVQF